MDVNTRPPGTVQDPAETDTVTTGAPALTGF